MPLPDAPSNLTPPAKQLRTWLARLAWMVSHSTEYSVTSFQEDMAQVWGPLDAVEKQTQAVERIWSDPVGYLRQNTLPVLTEGTRPVMVVDLTRLLNELKMRCAGQGQEVKFNTSASGYVRVHITEHKEIARYVPTEYDEEGPDE